MLTNTCALALALALQASPAPMPQRQATPPPASVSAVAEEDRPFADLFTNLAKDIRALPSLDSALILGVSSAGTLVLSPADDDLSEWAQENGESSYTGLGGALGDGWVQSGAAVAVYATGRLSGNRLAAHIGSDLIRAQFLNGVLTRGVKIITGRKRPSGGNYSFPSGHSSAAFASAAVLDGHFGWRTGVPAYAVAGFIGWTRVRDNAHWLSDVIMGGAIGAIVGRAVTAGHRERSWTVVPAATSRGVAVYFVKVD